MPILSHRPVKAKPIQRICQAAACYIENTKSQPDWMPERPKSLRPPQETIPKVEIWAGAKVAGAKSCQNLENRGMPISSHRPVKAKTHSEDLSDRGLLYRKYKISARLDAGEAKIS